MRRLYEAYGIEKGDKSPLPFLDGKYLTRFRVGDMFDTFNKKYGDLVEIDVKNELSGTMKITRTDGSENSVNASDYDYLQIAEVNERPCYPAERIRFSTDRASTYATRIDIHVMGEYITSYYIVEDLLSVRMRVLNEDNTGYILSPGTGDKSLNLYCLKDGRRGKIINIENQYTITNKCSHSEALRLMNLDRRSFFEKCNLVENKDVRSVFYGEFTEDSKDTIKNTILNRVNNSIIRCSEALKNSLHESVMSLNDAMEIISEMDDDEIDEFLDELKANF